MSLLRKYTPFSAHDGDLGCTNLISHDIPLVNETPVKQRYRRVLPSDYEAVKEHINQLLDGQAIRESSSPYASPSVLVKKKGGSLCMSVDCRQLNSKTRQDVFPLPHIEESFDALTGACWSADTTRSQLLRRVSLRLHSALFLVCLNATACKSGSVTPPVPFKD